MNRLPNGATRIMQPPPNCSMYQAVFGSPFAATNSIRPGSEAQKFGHLLKPHRQIGTSRPRAES